MKKIFIILAFMLFGMTQSASADSNVSNEMFEKWIKATSVKGWTLDQDSFEDYDGKEFSAAFICEKEGKMQNLAVKIVPLFNPEDEKSSEDIDNFTDLSSEKGRTFYYSFKKMSLSVIVIGIPELKASLKLTAAPQLSAEEMKTLLGEFDIAGLK